MRMIQIEKRKYEFLLSELQNHCEYKNSKYIDEHFQKIDDKMVNLQIGQNLYRTAGCDYGEFYQYEVLEIIDRDLGLVKVRNKWNGKITTEKISYLLIKHPYNY